MGEDTSLEDFLGGSDETAEAETETPGDEELAEQSDGEHATAETGGSEPAADTEAVETGEADETPDPATTTYAWDGAGAICADCGETVQRRWQQDGSLVCATCKSW